MYISTKIYMISIHAPRKGSDEILSVSQAWTKISIHAPRKGSDGEEEQKKEQ